MTGRCAAEAGAGHELLARLRRVRRLRPGHYLAACPAHADETPSLAVIFTAERILLHCHAGCAPAAVLQALGLMWGDLFLKKSGSGILPEERAKRSASKAGGKTGRQPDSSAPTQDDTGQGADAANICKQPASSPERETAGPGDACATVVQASSLRDCQPPALSRERGYAGPGGDSAKMCKQDACTTDGAKTCKQDACATDGAKTCKQHACATGSAKTCKQDACATGCQPPASSPEREDAGTECAT